MRSQIEKNVPTPEEQAQLEHLDKLEAGMDTELRMNCARTDEWISRLESELERPDCCEEAKQRISWLLYRIMDGEYDGPNGIYIEEGEMDGVVSGLKDVR